MTVNSLAQTITLTYDSALDASNKPPTTAFAATTAGAVNAVDSVDVSGATVTLKLHNAISSGAVSLVYTDPAGDTAATIQDTAGNDAVSFFSGVVVDGYVRGASVYIDTNHNGTADPASDYFVGVTDANGNFFVPAGAPGGTIIATGGVNIDTGAVNTMALKAPEGSTTINPLTTLVQAVVEDSGVTAAVAAATVATNLGLTVPAGQSLLDYDPYAADAAADLAAQKVSAQVATIVTMTDNAVSGGGAAAVADVIGNMVAQINNAGSSGDPVNLADSFTLHGTLDITATLTEAEQDNIAAAVNAIAGAGNRAAVASAQSVALDTQAPAAPTSLVVAATTNDTTPSVRVNFNTSAIDGTAAAAGDTLVLRDGNVQVGTVTLIAADIAAGFVTLNASTLAEGSHSLSARLTDQAGNVSAATSASVSIDTQAPTVTLSSSVAAVKAGESASISFSFSEAPMGFALADISASNGTMSNLSVTADPKVYTAIFTPTPGLSLGNANIAVAAESYADAAGNLGAAGAAPIIGIYSDVAPADTTAPAAPSIDPVATDNTVNIAEQSAVITGSAEALASVALSIGGNTRNVSASSTGAWSYTLTGADITAMGQGEETLSATATDAAHNSSSAGTRSITIDTLGIARKALITWDAPPIVSSALFTTSGSMP